MAKYDDKAIWRDKASMQKTLTGCIKDKGLKSHTSWKLVYHMARDKQEKNEEPQIYREYISKESKELIENKHKAETDENQEECNKYKSWWTSRYPSR